MRLSDAAADNEVFAVPLLDRVLLYACLHPLAALMTQTAAIQLSRCLDTGTPLASDALTQVACALRHPTQPVPQPRHGSFSPSFLGLLPTRACNLACIYCGFSANVASRQAMDLSTARDAVSWYANAVDHACQPQLEIRFFGGEPFCGEHIIDLVVHLARTRAEDCHGTVSFEVATNGACDARRARWAADNFDTIVLSLDGPASVQNRHRPYSDGRGSFDIVARNTRIFSEGSADLFIRACVTSGSVDGMAETAAWFCENFRPAGVAFEPLQPCTESSQAGLEPPTAWAFASNFIEACDVLDAYGVESIYSPADIRARRVSFCPVGHDAAIVSPDGTVSACYLLQRDWESRGLDLTLGHLNGAGLEPRENALEGVRSLNVHNKPRCSDCFCKWHCAGGCHVNHPCDDPPGTYDRLCTGTRIIALHNILQAMGQRQVAQNWLADPAAVERSVHRRSDRLCDLEASL